MAAFNGDLHFIFGLLGNIFSVLVYLAPLPTFYRIYRKRSTEEFLSIPYSVALFSAMLTLYYAFLKENGILLITINSIGCVIESAYLLLYIIYAPWETKIQSTRLILGFNIAAYSLIIILTHELAEGAQRVHIVGWICAGFSVAVFAAPLTVMRTVIRTKSVEYMPFWLAFFLTLCAVMWFFYGLLIRDFFVATPNVLGFAFGILQMILYMIYKNKKQPDLVKTLGSDPSILACKEMKEVVVDINVDPDETSASSYESEEGSGDDSNHGP